MGLTATGLAAGAFGRAPSGLPARPPMNMKPIKAIAFDAFPIFDPRPVAAMVDQLFPGKGADLSNEWRTRQFEYSWLRVVTGRYKDFWGVTQDALVFAAKKVGVEVQAHQRDALMNAHLGLKPWADVAPVLSTLRKSGYRLALLSNFTPTMLGGCIGAAGLEGVFEKMLSTDQAKTYKPDPRAYRLAVDALTLDREEILFVAYAGWDAVGAKAFGFPTYWVNRNKLPIEELGEVPDGEGIDLSGLPSFLAR